MSDSEDDRSDTSSESNISRATSRASVPVVRDLGNYLDEWDPSVGFPKYTAANRPSYIQSGSLMPFAALVIASRNNGKSHLARYLLKKYLLKKFDIVIIFSNTIATGAYDFINTSLKYSDYSADALERASCLIEETKKTEGMYPNTLVIFDDCSSQKVKDCEVIAKIFVQGRHSGMSIMFITQSPTYAQPKWRQNTTHLFLLRTKGEVMKTLKTNFIADIIGEDDIPGADDDTNERGINKFVTKLLRDIFKTPHKALVIEYEKSGNEFKSAAKTFIAPK